MASLDMPSKSFNFAILDEYGDDNSPGSPECSSLSIALSHEQDSVLAEISGNKQRGVSSTPDALALRLERLHIRTPAKPDLAEPDLHDWTPVNKSRGRRPRPGVGSSTFDKAPETVTDPKTDSTLETSVKGWFMSISNYDSPTYPTDTSITLEASEENPLAKQFEELDFPDWMQLAKHQAGRYEWVVSLPAKASSSEESTTRERSSTQGSSGSKGRAAKKVHFGCTMVRADGHSELVRRNRSLSGNTFTLIATPIESDDKPFTEHMESVVARAVKTACPAISEADEVKSLHGVIEEAKSLNSIVKQLANSPVSEHPTQGLDGVAEVKSQAVSRFSEHRDSLDLYGDSPDLISFAPPTSETFFGSKQDDTFDHSLRLPASPGYLSTNKDDENVEETLCFLASPSFIASPSSRIEDSVEALDEFEEQFEAISEATQLGRVLPREVAKRAVPSFVAAEQPATRRPLPTTAKQAAKPASGSIRGRPSERKPSFRHSIAVAPKKPEEKDSGKATTATKRLSVSKPASLLPPKPLARTVKPPTVPTFELSGDAVARRLKEKREARLSISMSTPAQVPRVASSSPAKAKTVTKPLTRPNFELPGEAISRRKREEREAKLKAQEEEERKRREFKARPVRGSISSGSLSYRETTASRARQSVIKTTTETTTPPAKKRYSTMAATIHGRPSLSRPALNLGNAPKAGSASKASTVRGRGSIAVSQNEMATRGTSSSGVSAEDKQAQKKRGKAIYERDNSSEAELERERRKKEAAWHAARAEAAERSREISRRWKEEQKLAGRSIGKSRSPSPLQDTVRDDSVEDKQAQKQPGKASDEYDNSSEAELERDCQEKPGFWRAAREKQFQREREASRRRKEKSRSPSPTYGQFYKWEGES